MKTMTVIYTEAPENLQKVVNAMEANGASVHQLQIISTQPATSWAQVIVVYDISGYKPPQSK
jgi:hypothetical protein